MPFSRMGTPLRFVPAGEGHVISHEKMKSKNKEFSLRPATIDDIDFIYDLRVKTMKPFFDGTLGWNEVKEREKAAYELKNAQIVLIGKKRVGGH